MRIVGFRAANTASTQYRTVNWIDAMGRLGHDVDTYGSPYNARDQRVDNNKIVEEFNERVSGADVVVYGLTVSAHEIALLQAGQDAIGYKLIVDTDDLVTEVPRYNQASTWYHNATGLIRIAESQYRSCNAVTVSTPHLRECMEHYQPNVIYMPNVVTDEIMSGLKFREKEARHRDDIRIYWGGGGGHWDDLLLVKDALLQIARENSRVKLVFGNFVPGWAMDLPPSQVYLIPMQPFSVFWKVLAWTCPDIGLAPLVDNNFNRCKSHVKYLDYAVCHAAGVYSDLDPYDSVKDGETGLKAKPDEWYDKIKALVDDPSLRRDIISRSATHVMDRWHINRWAGRYEQMLNEITTFSAPPVKALEEGKPISCPTSS